MHRSHSRSLRHSSTPPPIPSSRIGNSSSSASQLPVNPPPSVPSAAAPSRRSARLRTQTSTPNPSSIPNLTSDNGLDSSDGEPLDPQPSRRSARLRTQTSTPKPSGMTDMISDSGSDSSDGEPLDPPAARVHKDNRLQLRFPAALISDELRKQLQQSSISLDSAPPLPFLCAPLARLVLPLCKRLNSRVIWILSLLHTGLISVASYARSLRMVIIPTATRVLLNNRCLLLLSRLQCHHNPTYNKLQNLGSSFSLPLPSFLMEDLNSAMAVTLLSHIIVARYILRRNPSNEGTQQITWRSSWHFTMPFSMLLSANLGAF